MEEAPENGKESPHSVHANGLINGCTLRIFTTYACTLFFLFFYALNFITEFLLHIQKIAG